MPWILARDAPHAIVSTIRYGEITNEYNEGADCLRNYLRYAEAMSAGDSATVQSLLNSIIRWKGQFAHEQTEADDGVVVQLPITVHGQLRTLGKIHPFPVLRCRWPVVQYWDRS
jgi:hypothetical protein